MGEMAKHRRRLPPWLIGLAIAAVLFVVVLIVANALGFGDDPVIGVAGSPNAASEGTTAGTAWVVESTPAVGRLL